MELQKSFRVVSSAIDKLRPDQATDFLARLVLILANEIGDAEKIANAVDRALSPVSQGEEG
ncbi:DUF2783 domain-containing protein [Candidimonas humi]|uniref:DUF2783 domain-containing protein n=1 Tax=Candidimonas humi TaxID=683355 RepID=A0ABV8P298_9BURK|nr:DUF2783 domain-containing protein [Candidimonas humi]MBV6305592.1 DUF2783 domain-containing protein [Candidimonas humi]